MLRSFMKSGNVDLNLLRAFDALMREKHVTRAADRIDISQSSMSGALARLREIFNDELLTRSGASLVPTELALSIYPRAQDALASAMAVFETRTAFDPAVADHVFRLIVGDYLDVLMVPSIMQRVGVEAPGVRMHMLQPRPQHFPEMLSAGELDLAISYLPSPPEFLKSRRLFSDRFVALAAADHPAVNQPLTVEQFCELEHVTIEPEATQVYNTQIDMALEPFGVRRRVKMIKPNFLALPFLLESTRLVSCIPVRLARRMSQMAKVAMFDIPLDLPTFDVRLLWHPRTSNSAAHDWLRGVVVECARLA